MDHLTALNRWLWPVFASLAVAVAGCEHRASSRKLSTSGVQSTPASMAATSAANTPSTPYEQWVQRFSARNESSSPTPDAFAVVTVVSVEKESAQPDRGIEAVPEISRFYINAQGKTSTSSQNGFEQRSSGFWDIKPADFSRLRVLLSQMPSDKGRLPPPDRRVMIEIMRPTWSCRVYDRADLPDSILEILRLGNANVRADVAEFSSSSEIDTGGFSNFSLTAVNPHDSTIVCVREGDALSWSPIAHEYVGRKTLSQRSLREFVFSPDGKMAAGCDWGACTLFKTDDWGVLQKINQPVEGRSKVLFTKPRFTSDGRHLILQCSDNTVAMYDTATGQETPTIRGIPANASQYFPTSSADKAVVRLQDKRVCLWDSVKNVSIAILDVGPNLYDVSFSPDGSQFATIGGDANQRNMNITLWSGATGRLLHRLRPYETSSCESAIGLVWTADSRYIMSASKADAFSSMNISEWDARTGRDCAEFTGCPAPINGIALLPDGSTLIAGCIDGKIRFWEFSAAMRQVRQFESSLHS